MPVNNNKENLYKDFLSFEYSELELLVVEAKDKVEREFYARLCDFYLAQNQPRVMQENPF